MTVFPEPLGYLTKFVVTGSRPTSPNQVIWIHNPATFQYGRHYVLESFRTKIRASETATNVWINTDRDNRAPILERTITQELLFKGTSISAIESYYETLQDARGWEGWLYKSNILATKSRKIWATLDGADVIEPVREMKRELILNIYFFIWNSGWEQG